MSVSTAHDIAADSVRLADEQNRLVLLFCALAELNPVDRECWVNRKILGLGDKEQAAILGVTRKRVWQRVTRAQQRIDAFMERAAA